MGAADQSKSQRSRRPHGHSLPSRCASSQSVLLHRHRLLLLLLLRILGHDAPGECLVGRDDRILYNPSVGIHDLLAPADLVFLQLPAVDQEPFGGAIAEVWTIERGHSSI